jgi:hypothetical protein
VTWSCDFAVEAWVTNLRAQQRINSWTTVIAQNEIVMERTTLLRIKMTNLRESEAKLQQPHHEIELRIEDEVDLEDECDYGYSKQVVDGDEEDEDGWQDEDEDLDFLLDDVLGAEDGEGDDDDMGFGEF